MRAPSPLRAALLGLALLVGLDGPARADPAATPATAPPSTTAQPDPGAATRALRSRRRLAAAERAAGIGIAGAAFAAIACGVVLITTSYSPLQRFEDGAVNRSAGLITMGVGALTLIPGVALAALGQHHINNLDWRLKEVAVAPLLGPAPGGGFLVGARLSF